MSGQRLQGIWRRKETMNPGEWLFSGVCYFFLFWFIRKELGKQPDSYAGNATVFPSEKIASVPFPSAAGQVISKLWGVVLS